MDGVKVFHARAAVTQTGTMCMQFWMIKVESLVICYCAARVSSNLRPATPYNHDLALADSRAAHYADIWTGGAACRQTTLLFSRTKTLGHHWLIANSQIKISIRGRETKNTLRGSKVGLSLKVKKVTHKVYAKSKWNDHQQGKERERKVLKVNVHLKSWLHQLILSHEVTEIGMYRSKFVPKTEECLSK